MKKQLFLTLLLGASISYGQAPQIPVTGNLGAGGSFPAINSPAVVFATDANHTMVFPEMSGSSGVVVVTSTGSLTATRNLVVPLMKGFNWQIQNATTGGQSIVVIGASGTGVTIPNGATANVHSDGTNITAVTATSSLAVTGPCPSGGTGSCAIGTPGTAATPTAGKDILNDVTGQGWQESVNGGALSTICTPLNGLCGGGGGSLPTATSAGQMYTSTAAGTTAAVQGQIFYSQSGDTIASIETECSSACTYVVTSPQTFTLGANHALSSNVFVRFNAGGKWTVNGAFTLTFSNTPTSDALTQHFAGTSTLAGFSGSVPVEWFGAVGFSTKAGAAGGPDYSTNIQKALDSITVGGWAFLQPLCYNATAGVTITTSSVGIHGTMGRDPAPAGASCLVQTSALGTLVSVHGTSGTYITWNSFENFSLEHTAQPTGTDPTASAGMFIQYAGGVTLRTITANDFLDGIHYNGAPGYGLTNYAVNCSNGNQTVNSYVSGQVINCLDIDSTNGVGMNTLQIVGATLYTINSAGCSLGVISTGINMHGTAINDIDLIYPQTAGSVCYGAKVVYTGSGTVDTAADIHITQPIFEFLTAGVYISGLTPIAAMPSVSIDSGYMLGVNSVKYIDCENSIGVQATGNQFLSGVGGTSTAYGIYANGCSGLIATGNKMENIGGTGVALVGTTGATVTANSFTGITTGISAASTSTANSIVANAIDGTGTTGLTFDSTSVANNVVANPCGSGITTCNGGSVPTGKGASYMGDVYSNGTLLTLTPVYNASGTLQSNAHTVIGSGTLSSNTLAITLSGSAVFSSSSSYRCEAHSTDNSTISFGFTYASGSSFSAFGDSASTPFRYTCTGN